MTTLHSASTRASPRMNDVPEPLRRFIAANLSVSTANQLVDIIMTVRNTPGANIVRDPTDFQANYAASEAAVEHLVGPAVDKLDVTFRRDTLGGVPVLRVMPNQFSSGTPLLYTHGGGFVSLSAHSSRLLAALVANATGREVVSVDYQVAPTGNWVTITDQVIAAWKGLLAEGHRAGQIGWVGDSAGGGLVLGTVLKLRDLALPCPGALFVLSPWTDLTCTSDTLTTLDGWDLMLQPGHLPLLANAYAPAEHQRHPYASPVFGNFGADFPPTLIQCGLRELLLSDSVRLYQAIRSGGSIAELDLYEGMPHVFPVVVPWADETRTALARGARFLHCHSGTPAA